MGPRTNSIGSKWTEKRHRNSMPTTINNSKNNRSKNIMNNRRMMESKSKRMGMGMNSFKNRMRAI